MLDTSRWRRSFELLVDGRGEWPRGCLQGELGPATISQRVGLCSRFAVQGGRFDGATIVLLSEQESSGLASG